MFALANEGNQVMSLDIDESSALSQLRTPVDNDRMDCALKGSTTPPTIKKK